MDTVAIIQPQELAEIIRCKCEKFLIVDARTFCEYNTSHIVNSVNVWSSKIRKKRLQQDSISVHDFLQQACHISLQEITFEEVIVYDQSATYPHAVPLDTFLYVLLLKLSSSFSKVYLLHGGFLEFQSQFYEMCEDSSQKSFLLTSFSQPCLPISNAGPTKILPFLFLGSQYDANNKQLLLEHNISYELNVSTSCPKPDFLQDSHFLRIAVNDNFSAKLLPHFEEALTFIDKVREIGGRVLVHCLAGISRSPTVVISYVMKYLHLHYDEAYRYVKTRRPTISPNINFVGQLLEFDLHLFGNSALFRSPPDPLYLPLDSLERDDCPLGLSPGGSLLLKSSSSSCLGIGDETGFPFQLNRSLPSLRLSKSGPDVPSLRPRQCLLSPSSDFDGFLSSFGLGENVKNIASRCGYVSDRLPSSPVDTEEHPLSPLISSSPRSHRYVACSSLCTYVKGNSPEKTDCSQSPSDLKDIVKIKERGEIQSGNSVQHPLSGKTFLSCEKLDGLDDESEKEKSVSPKCALIEESQDRTPNTICENEKDKISSKAEESETSNLPHENPLQPHKSELRIEVEYEGTALENTPEETFHSETQSELDPLSSEATEAKNIQTETKSGDSSSDKAKMTKLDPRSSLPPKKELEPCPKPETPEYEVSTNSSKAPKGLSRKMEPSQLPRSHSSSETYLNTRRRLERQAAAAHSGGAVHTRKSFSSDEVLRGFQGGAGVPQATPTTVSSSGSQRESFINSSDLARCDSWSTSGLGSEISDWESLQGDAQSVLLEDTQGPFDAVFAEVYPGEGQSVPTFHSFRRNSERRGRTDGTRDKRELTKTFSLEAKPQGDFVTLKVPAEERSAFISSEDSRVSCPTPRPVSLPGVSGNYNLVDSSVNVDMGLGMEDSEDWPKENVHIFNFPRLVPVKGQNLTEYPPVNPRTMGEDVKYLMTWYKIDTSSEPGQTMVTDSTRKVSLPKNTEVDPQKDGTIRCSERREAASLPREVSVAKNGDTYSTVSVMKSLSSDFSDLLLKGKLKQDFDLFLCEKRETRDLCKSTNAPKSTSPSDVYAETKREATDFFLDESKSFPESPGKDEGVVFPEQKLSRSDRTDSLHKRWQKWEEEFNKKIRNIKKNVSLSSWDHSSNDESEEPHEELPSTHGNMAGFHLAQELMQSMEDLLEREICDIKRQAKSLSARFGLTLSSDRSPSPLSPVLTRTDSFIVYPQGESSSFKKTHVAEREIEVPIVSDDTCARTCPCTGLAQSKSCSLPHVSPDYPDHFRCIWERTCPRNGLLSLARSGDSNEPGRAKSEPPMGMEETLYRVKSCPGIAGGKGLEENRPNSKPTNFRFPRLFLSGNGNSKRYSCSALDHLPESRPSFESCPDVSALSPFQRDSSPSSAGPSPSSSFNRLLKVS